MEGREEARLKPPDHSRLLGGVPRRATALGEHQPHEPAVRFGGLRRHLLGREGVSVQ